MKVPHFSKYTDKRDKPDQTSVQATQLSESNPHNWALGLKAWKRCEPMQTNPRGTMEECACQEASSKKYDIKSYREKPLARYKKNKSLG